MPLFSGHWQSSVLLLQSIMATLKAPEDDMAQLETLGRLCEMLSISSEEQLSVLPVDQLVPVLVSCEGWSRDLQMPFQYYTA